MQPTFTCNCAEILQENDQGVPKILILYQQTKDLTLAHNALFSRHAEHRVQFYPRLVHICAHCVNPIFTEQRLPTSSSPPAWRGKTRRQKRCLEPTPTPLKESTAGSFESRLDHIFTMVTPASLHPPELLVSRY